MVIKIRHELVKGFKYSNDNFALSVVYTVHNFIKSYISELAEVMCFANLPYEDGVGGGLLGMPTPESTEGG